MGGGGGGGGGCTRERELGGRWEREGVNSVGVGYQRP